MQVGHSFVLIPGAAKPGSCKDCNLGYIVAMDTCHNTAEAYFDASPTRTFGFRLWHVHHAFIRHLEAALMPLDLTHIQYVILRSVDYLAQAGERPTQTRLAEVMGTDRMMASKVLRLLEGKGLVVRPVHPEDCRAHHVVLTEAGRRLLARAVPLGLQAQQQFFGRLGPAGMETLSGLLDELLQLDGNPIASADIVTVTSKDAP